MSGVYATETRIGWMKEDPIWKPWAKQGWQLVIGPTRTRIMAVNERLKMGTDGAKTLLTIVRRLEGKKVDYRWYVASEKARRP
jgi:hypothetical protein